MIFFRIPKGRRVNKLFAIIFAVLTVISVIVSMAAKGHDRALHETYGMIAAVLFCFFLLFFILWFIYRRIEKKMQKSLMASSNNEDIMSYDLYGVDDATFEIPYKNLLSAARNRFFGSMKMIRITCIIFAIILVILNIKNNGFNGIATITMLITIAFFPLLIFLVIQSPQYYLYKKTIPNKIAFRMSILEIDQKQFYARDISEIIISSEQKENVNSGIFYRTLTVREGVKKNIYRVDFRDQRNPSLRYDDYGLLVKYVKKWCHVNRVKFTIDYMD